MINISLKKLIDLLANLGLSYVDICEKLIDLTVLVPLNFKDIIAFK